jgi:hypothetical protein
VLADEGAPDLGVVPGLRQLDEVSRQRGLILNRQGVLERLAGHQFAEDLDLVAVAQVFGDTLEVERARAVVAEACSAAWWAVLNTVTSGASHMTSFATSPMILA